jgi:ADP-heptose:LPS heptosyltransferase
MRPTRIAILQLARFGDLIQSSPLILRLMLQNPESEITLIVDSRTQAVAKMLVGVDRVIPLELTEVPWRGSTTLSDKLADLISWLNTTTPAAAFDQLYILNQDPFSGALAELIPAQMRIGPELKRLLPAPHRYLTLAVQDRQFNPLHLSEIWAAYAGSQEPIPRPQITKTALGTGFALVGGKSSASSMKIKRFALNLSAKAAGRRPPWEKLAELTTGLLASDSSEIVLLGMNEDRVDANKLIRSLPEDHRGRVSDLTGRTRLEDLPGVLAACDVLISGDTGTLQLAAATGTKCIGMFMAGANPVETGPYVEGAVAIVRRNTLEFSENQRDDLGDLPVEKVVTLAITLAQDDMPNGRMLNADDAFAVLMARSDGVGLSYTPLTEEDSVPLGKGKRWLPYLRHLLYTNEDNTARQLTWSVQEARFSSEQYDLLMRLLTKPTAAITDEERWLLGIVHAFALETANLLNDVHNEALGDGWV